MERRKLLKAILQEAIKRNLEEMPQIKKFYTLTDDWESKLGNIRGYGNRFQDIALKLESLEDMNHFNVEDIKKVFNIKGTGDASTFVKALVQKGIIMHADSATIKPKDLGIGAEDDEFSVMDLPDTELTQGIDMASALRKINIDKAVTHIDFTITENFKVEIPREEQRRLAVQYGSVSQGMYKEYGTRGDTLTKRTNFRTNRYKFLKPFLEDKWYLKVPGETVYIKKYDWRSNHKITSLFKSIQDFSQFVQENPRSFKVTVTPRNFDEIKQKIESVGGKLVPQGEMQTYISS